MKGLRKILRVSWTAKKTNEWVLKAGVKRKLLRHRQSKEASILWSHCEETIRMPEDRDKWSKYVHGVANPRIEDG